MKMLSAATAAAIMVSTGALAETFTVTGYGWHLQDSPSPIEDAWEQARALCDDEKLNLVSTSSLCGAPTGHSCVKATFTCGEEDVADSGDASDSGGTCRPTNE